MYYVNRGPADPRVRSGPGACQIFNNVKFSFVYTIYNILFVI